MPKAGWSDLRYHWLVTKGGAMAFNLDELKNDFGNATKLTQVWDEVKDKGANWSTFHEVLDQHRSDPEVSDNEVDQLHEAGQQAEQEGQSFPSSFAELTQKLRDKL